MMTMSEYLPQLGAWMQSADGSNTLFALICLAALAGLPGRFCVAVTLLVHLALVLL